MFISAYILLADAVFGEVSPPPGVDKFAPGTTQGEGIIVFVSNLIKVITIIAGLFGLFNIISAGYTFLGSNGNPKAAEEAANKLFMSLIGLAIIVGSFTLTAIVSLLLFGDPTYILSPKIPGA